MKLTRFKAAIAALCAFFALCLSMPLFACSQQMPYRKIGDKNDFLKAEGSLVKNGNGETVALRGVNAGGLFVTEHWMTGFVYGKTSSNDYKSLTLNFIERFGEQKTKKLWAEYRANWWTETDFKNCADMGMNVIRLPFTYMNVDFGAITDYNNAGNYDFSDLDAFVEKAAEYGMYTILDLHGAYGSQSGQDHTGEILDYTLVDFYSNEQLQNLTVNLWSALAEHYKNNSAVAGYDILNEPGERISNGNDGVKNTEKRHWDFFDKVYDTIRAKGDNHIVIFESCWNGENLPQPSIYGWENCMYSFHHYTSNTDISDAGVLSHNSDWNRKVANVTAQDFGVPLQMGEFTNYNSEEKWEYTLGLLNRANWHWTSWTYKVWGNMPWGIVNITGTNSDKIDPASDSYESILKKFKNLRTDGASAQKYTFYSTKENGEMIEGRTLESIFAEYTAQPAFSQTVEAGDYEIYYGEDYRPLTVNGNIGGNAVFNIGDSAYDIITFTVSPHSSKDGSVYISSYGGNLTVFKYGGINYITAGDSTAAEARFYPVITDEGIMLISYSTCKYLRIDEEGIVRADADKAKAAVFALGTK